jgi:hypothetical protein
MMCRPSHLFVLLGLVFVGGCGPYVDGYHYLPHPAVAEIRTTTTTTQPAAQPQPLPSPLVAYASIVGVRRENRDLRIPLSVEVRLRLDNRGPQAVQFDPRSLDLTTAELLPFPPPLVNPPGPATLNPGQTLIVAANFPFPPGHSYDNTNLQALELHWAVMLDGKPIPQSADFHRVYYRYYYNPYYDYGYYPYGYGYPYYPYVGIGGTVIIRR